MLALMLLPPENPELRRARGEGSTAGDYRQIGRTAVSWILLGGVLLCNLYHTVTTAQLGVVLGDSLTGADTGGQVSLLISVFAVAVIVGRFACGVALDRLPAQAVALALPGFG
ncbi:hypothetical protein [Mycobacterium sp. C31M]